MERINDIGVQTFVKEKAEKIVAVMTGGFKSYFYFVQILRCGLNSAEKKVETIEVIFNSKHFSKYFTLRGNNVAIVLFLCDVNSNV